MPHPRKRVSNKCSELLPGQEGTTSSLPSFPDWLEADMEAVIRKVIQTYCMMNTLTGEQAENAKSAVANYLANNPQADFYLATGQALRSTRCPYTTLFRSEAPHVEGYVLLRGAAL